MLSPHVTYFPDEGHWELLEPYSYFSSEIQRVIIIPEGFKYDLSSVPFALRVLVERHDFGLIAPLLHDYMYRNRGRITVLKPPTTENPTITTGKMKVSKKVSDKIFLNVAKKDGVPKWLRITGYSLLRIFGIFAWMKK